MHEWVWKTALNAKTKEKKWLEKAWRSVPNGFESQNGRKWWWIKRKIDVRTLTVEVRMWLWTPNERHQIWRWTKETALNAKLKASNGSGRRKEAKHGSERRTKIVSGSKCQNEAKHGFEQQNEWGNGSERWNEDVSSGSERRMKISSVSERQNETKQGAECWNEWRSGSKHRMKMRLWTSSEDVALNTKWSKTRL